MNSTIERALSVMRDFRGPWGFAGGWALDLFIGRESRVHPDVDIAILRADQRQLRARLSGRVEKVVAGQLVDWPPAERLERPVHEIHVTWPDGHHLELLLNESDHVTHEWVFRRDSRIRRALDVAFATYGDAPFLAPEIVLLYKSKAPAAKDERDFHAVMPRLAARQRLWLRQALEITAPDHPWVAILTRDA